MEEKNKILHTLKSIWEGWKRVAKVIGKVQTCILLFLLYFFVVGPISIVIRLCGKDLLDKRIDKTAKGLWKRYPVREFSEEHYKHEF